MRLPGERASGHVFSARADDQGQPQQPGEVPERKSSIGVRAMAGAVRRGTSDRGLACNLLYQLPQWGDMGVAYEASWGLMIRLRWPEVAS